ncbi:AbiH family protein [Pilibacter termitis]|uniref:AbiH family protein n=1 Tax=Pilibacter termitis TaxID=263852 RepID=UPI0013562EE4|nr:AbiH family protein [Pilibacter termitis]
MSTLVVLGNGFDLACGLKSSYSAFFDKRYNNEEFEKNWGIFLNSSVDYIQYFSEENIKKWNFWDFIFGFRVYDPFLISMLPGKFSNMHFFKSINDHIPLNVLSSSSIGNNSNETWQDIEEVLSTISKSIANESGVIHSNVVKSIKEYISNGKVNCSFLAEKREQTMILFLSKLYILKFKNDALFPLNLKNKGFLNRFLLHELRQFEIIFTEYLIEEVNKVNKDYIIKANELLRQILTEVELNEDYDVKLLNFNYTTPFYNNDSFYVQNIHGTLKNNNTIFGIDNHNAEPSLKNFTKTYRILEMSIDRLSFVDAINNKNIGRIKFYGHSLGKADYSYFQSIFDGINLYESDVVLEFFYSNYDPEIDEKTNLTNRIFDLISEYGKTLDNKDHGKNIVHKLVLENRVIIKEI